MFDCCTFYKKQNGGHTILDFRKTLDAVSLVLEYYYITDTYIQFY